MFVVKDLFVGPAFIGVDFEVVSLNDGQATSHELLLVDVDVDGCFLAMGVSRNPQQNKKCSL